MFRIAVWHAVVAFRGFVGSLAFVFRTSGVGRQTLASYELVDERDR
jgi:hypothetical protein